MPKIVLVNRNVLLLLACFVTTFASCQNKMIKLDMIHKNPVEYVFNSPKDSLYKAMTKEHGFLGLSVMTIKDKKIMPSEIAELFLKPNNAYDIFLWSIGVYGKSKIYMKKNGSFFDYWVSFYLHLEKTDDNHTKISIKTIEPKIITGKELLPSPPHMVRKDKTMQVESSTIEEYEILLEIGRVMGEKNMPALSLPEKN
jgi:hypothetical protein